MAKAQRARLEFDRLEDRLALSGLSLSGVEFRTIDGTNNNLTFTSRGAAETRQVRFGYGVRFTEADVNNVGDVLVGPSTTPGRPNSRTISNAIHAQSGSVPSARLLTDWAFQWGQWITHDMDLTRNGAQWNTLSTGGTGDYRIPILDPNDPLYNASNPYIPFNRSEFDAGAVNDTPPSPPRRHQINSITSYLDASVVYGSDTTRAAALRTFSGGRLKTSANGQLLPLNTAGLPNADQFGAGSALFLAGDVRANEQAGLTVVHTLFVREHNRLAARIQSLYPNLNDEQIYQVARRIVAAEIQAITYREYLPAILGYDLAPRAQAAAYSSSVDASITNSFAHAAFRFGHSQISSALRLVNNNGQNAGSLSIAQAFFNPNFLKNDTANFARVLKGLASQVGQENDLLLVDGVRNSLFGPPGSGGIDLAALDIERGRDHGLPDYNRLRNAYGVPRVTSFAEISSDPTIQATLQQLFGSVDNIDPFVGMLAEDHLPGTSVGPLINAIVGNQFERLRDGDRFFYTNDAFLNSAAVKRILDINTVTLANVIRWNSNITNLQDNVFFDRSVMIYHAPESGANLTVITANGKVTILNTLNGQVLAQRSLSEVSQVIIVGSHTAADVINLYVPDPNNGLERGVVVYGGGSAGDRLNVFGRPLVADAFIVTDRTVTTGTVNTAGDDTTQTVSGRTVQINGNVIESTGFETTRLVTLGGQDTIQIADGLIDVLVAALWNPWSSD